MSNKMVNYVDPNSRDYKEYFDHLLAFNKRVQDNSSTYMGNCLTNLKNGWAVATTGSDARLEKGPISPIELVLFTGCPQCSGGVAEDLKSCISSEGVFSLYDQNIEFREISGARFSDFILNKGQSNEVRLVSPNRMFDCHFMFGNQDIYFAAKRAFLSEFNTSYGKSVFEKVKDRTKDHIEVTLTGEQKYTGGQLLKHFDMDQGFAIYDPSNKLWGLKQGPIRAVQ
jgi:hypothetical protein